MTLFPEMVLPALNHSILARAQSQGHVSFGAVNPRDFTVDAHKTVDDSPYGGGDGMVMKVDVVARAVRSLHLGADTVVVYTDPNGKRFDQAAAQRLSHASRVVFLCGHYEGMDDRVRQLFATESLSIGDFVLTGGELAALVISDAMVRLIPGVLGSPDSLEQDSHNDGLLSYPQYTRPEDFEGVPVPEVLKSGNHERIRLWRRQQALQATRLNRPDLFSRAELSKEDLDLL